MYKKTVLNNGVRLISKRLAGAYSVTVGLWLDVGSRDEEPSMGGASHFIEHMAFKGTLNRGPLEIAQEIDRLGGMANAFTSKEQTCFHARALTDKLPRVCGLLLDLALRPAYDPVEMERERGVILQEISAMEDTPDDLVHVLFCENYWGKHPLGMPVLGSAQSVANMDRQVLLDYQRERYSPQNLVVAAVGDLDHQELVDLMDESLSPLKNGQAKTKRQSPQPRHSLNVTRRESEQVHVALGAPAPSAVSSDRFAAALVNMVLGGNMSSRLFQEVREKRGLAYAVYSYLNSYQDCGVLGIYLGVAPDRATESLKVVRAEMEKLAAGGIQPQELEDARDNLKGSLVLAAENPESRMSRLARNELLFGRVVPIDEIIAEIDALEMEHIHAMAEKLLNNGLGVTMLGPVDEDDMHRELGW